VAQSRKVRVAIVEDDEGFRDTIHELVSQERSLQIELKMDRMALPTSTPKPTFTPTPRPTSRTGFGPLDGSIAHSDDGFIDTFDSGIFTQNAVVEAEFDNLYSTFKGSWDQSGIGCLSTRHRAPS